MFPQIKVSHANSDISVSSSHLSLRERFTPCALHNQKLHAVLENLTLGFLTLSTHQWIS